eukprot:4786150-Amphidinium_carterae.1
MVVPADRLDDLRLALVVLWHWFCYADLSHWGLSWHQIQPAWMQSLQTCGMRPLEIGAEVPEFHADAWCPGRDWMPVRPDV